VSGVQAVDEWQRYSLGRAAAHTAFDTALAVSADEPSLLWVALALASAGLDGAGLLWSFRVVAPAARALGETGGGLAAFDAQIKEVAELSPVVRQALHRAAAAEADYQRALSDLGVAWRRSLTGQSAGALAGNLSDSALRVAYYWIRDKATGATTWDLFAQHMRTHKSMKGVDWDDPKSLTDLREAYTRAHANVSADRQIAYVTAMRGELAGQELALARGRPFFALADYDDGVRRITFDTDGNMLLDGVAVSANKRAEVYQKAGIYHAVTGHGADSSYELIAQESNQLFHGTKPLPGKSSRFASDEVMFRAIHDARRAYDEGLGLSSPDNPKYLLIDFPVNPSTGRCFAHYSRIPPGTPILNLRPFGNLKNVREVGARWVRAIFDPTDGSLVTIYPIGF